ncbi:hypothetical protein AAIG28_24300 [Citrobacter freundii]|uniref:gp53-like domain-containing protein n=1 Tax=Citrobacter freundii TaxID=546 RepID=UPI001B9F5065|nr:hypothetical protein [Escherichia coli]
MHRIDTPTAQKDKFGAGKNGFTRGNPQTGTPATDLDDDYFDMLQEELAGVVEASGVNLEKSKHNQLLTALKALLLSRAHPFADIKADGAAAIAEALSNLGFTAGNGWFNLGGTIIQMGYVNFTTTSQPVTFPIPFPKAVDHVIVSDAGWGGGNMWGATDKQLGGFVAHVDSLGEGGQYIAFGK